MTDPSFTAEGDRDLLVVLHTREETEEASRRLLRAGLSLEDLAIDDEADRVTSLRAEMHDELTHSYVVPNAGVVYPKEAVRGLVVGVGIGMAIGLLAAFPLALLPVGDVGYGTRLIAFLLVGGAFGLAIGLVAGPAAGSKRPNQPSAIEQGVLLRVRHDNAMLRSLLAELHPIRMDEVRRSDDQPIATVYLDDERSTVHATARDLARNVRGDDYHPDPDDRRSDGAGNAVPPTAPPGSVPQGFVAPRRPAGGAPR